MAGRLAAFGAVAAASSPSGGRLASSQRLGGWAAAGWEPYTRALWDFHKTSNLDLTLFAHVSAAPDDGPDEVAVSRFFCDLDDVEPLERLAMELAEGRILDVGAGAGNHARLLQDERGADVTALDADPACTALCLARGIRQVVTADALSYAPPTGSGGSSRIVAPGGFGAATDGSAGGDAGRYDTVLMLMNGLGVAGTLDGLRALLRHTAQHVLKPGGTIYTDSTDIVYCFPEADGTPYVAFDAPYYGMVSAYWEYQGVAGAPFPWLYIDFPLLADLARECGYAAELLAIDDEAEPHYLAALTVVDGGLGGLDADAVRATLGDPDPDTYDDELEWYRERVRRDGRNPDDTNEW